LAHSLGIPGNILESSGTPKTLKNLHKSETFNDIKALGMASQAYDEGSIPFTRSMNINKIDKKHFTRVHFGTEWHPRRHRMVPIVLPYQRASGRRARSGCKNVWRRAAVTILCWVVGIYERALRIQRTRQRCQPAPKTRRIVA
jgi:hypothetical protein